MKTILNETISIIKVTLFWAVALPAAAVTCALVAGWDKIRAPAPRRSVAPAGLLTPHFRPAHR